MSTDYTLSCVLYGHTLDVRSLAITSEEYLISASRDKTAKVWQPQREELGFKEISTLAGHKGFVSCVCFLQPDNKHPSGLIVTGSNDKLIFVYCPITFEKLYTLEGHSSTVCGVSPGILNSTLVSSSWDTTARIWKIDNGVSSQVFEGHSAAVWSGIQLLSGEILSGSADKSIKVWSLDGICLKTLVGHTDCVRQLSATSASTFLSCANDATIRHWNTSGECLSVFYGHSNYIYDLAVFKETEYGCMKSFVSCGEDQTIRIWKDGKCKQTILLPAQSAWAVVCFRNGDIAVGTSDGVIRIFSCDPSRRGNEMLLNQFTEEIANTNKNSNNDLGDIKINDLPGTEALNMDGQSDGQTKLIREGQGAVCYKWSSANSQWEKLGEVIGAGGGSQQNGGKVYFEGKEYDYVFSVDIEEGKPPLKLPYNKSEDPWTAAQKFIHKNNLSQLYLDQVANFITKNVEPQPQLISNSYSNPFADSREENDVETKSSVYFPQSTYLRFDQANTKLILEKLAEFNQKTGDGVHKIDESHLLGVIKLTDPSSPSDESSLEILKQLLEWPPDIVFPALDVTRLALRNESVNTSLCSGDCGDRFVSFLRRFLRSESLLTNQLMTLRIFCNMMCHKTGEMLVLKHKQYLLSVVTDIQQPSNKHLQIAITTLLLNFGVAFQRNKDYSGVSLAVSSLIKILPKLCESEAQFRGMVAIGTIIFNMSDKAERDKLIKLVLESAEMQMMLENLSSLKSEDKRTQCALQVLALLFM